MQPVGSNLYHYQLGEGCESAARSTFKYLFRPSSDSNLHSVRNSNLSISSQSDIRDLPSFGMDFNTGHLPYGDTLRSHRKMLHQTINPSLIHKYHETVTEKTRALLENLVHSPEKFGSHMRM